MQAIGLPSETVTDRQNMSGWLQKTREHLSMRRSRIEADYMRAIDENDAKGKLDAKREFRELRKSQRRQGIKPDSPVSLDLPSRIHLMKIPIIIQTKICHWSSSTGGKVGRGKAITKPKKMSLW